MIEEFFYIIFKESDKEKRKESRDIFFKETLPKGLQILEKRLNYKNSKYVRINLNIFF